MSEALPARMSLNVKIERLRISEENFENYCSTFVKNWSSYLIMETEPNWFLVKNKTGRPVRLTKDIVAYHLLGKYWISTFSPDISRSLCLDLDPSPEMNTTYHKIKEWVKDPLVFRSSQRGGLHLYVHLDFAMKNHKLLKFAEMELKLKKVRVAPGICEILPSPNKALRLPLGRGGCLLDSETLTPICPDLGAAINFISKNIKHRTLQELFPGLWRRLNENR